MSHEYVYKISSQYLQKWLRYNIIYHKTCQKQALITSFRDFTVIFRILFLTDFDASKVFRFIFRVLCENLT